MASPFAILRLVVFSLATLLSIIVLCISSHVLTVISSHNYVWDGFAIAIASLTISTFPALIVVGLVRKNAFLNYVIVELAWITILCVLWLASAILDTRDIWLSQAGQCEFDSGLFKSLWVWADCTEFWAILGFSWAILYELTAYTILLLVLTILQQVRGNHVWTNSVNSVNFFAPRTGAVITNMVEAPGTPDMVKSGIE